MHECTGTITSLGFRNRNHSCQQSGIDRGYYNETDFNLLTKWMIEEFRKNSLEIKRVYFCPHHPNIYGECDCRKPKPGMFLEAQKEYNIDMQHSIMIGDSERDITAAIEAGVKKHYLLSSINVPTQASEGCIKSLSEIV